MNLFSVLNEAAKNWPGDAGIIRRSEVFRYGDLHRGAETLASELRRLGLGRGTKIGVLCPDIPEQVMACFGALRAGGICIPLSQALTSEEIARFANEMAIDGFCYTPHCERFLPRAHVDIRRVPIPGSGKYLVMKRTEKRSATTQDRDALLRIDAAVIRLTSGTTGDAKGVILSHAALLERAKVYRAVPPLGRDDAILLLYTTGTLVMNILCSCMFEGTRAVISDAVDAQAIVKLIKQHGVTRVYASPLFFRAVTNDKSVEAKDFRDITYLFCTGSSLSAAAADAFAAKFGREVVEHYGLVESGPVLMNLSQQSSKRGSVGTIRGNSEVNLSGGEWSSQDIGELCVRGPGLFDGYYRPWRSRDDVLEDGWFRTGDIARRDADGYYWIVGRVKDVINVGGVKVFPHEIEEVLLSHPAVEEAVVYGVPEARFGEVPRAKVKLRAGVECAEKEILQYANEKLSVFKALRLIEFVDEISKTVTGKPRRSG